MLKNIQPERLQENKEDLQLKINTQTEVEETQEIDISGNDIYDTKIKVAWCPNIHSEKVQNTEASINTIIKFLKNGSESKYTQEEYSYLSPQHKLREKEDHLLILWGKTTGDGRKKEDILLRSALNFDFDNADSINVIDKLKSCKYIYIAYATINSTQDKLRLRVIVPVSPSNPIKSEEQFKQLTWVVGSKYFAGTKYDKCTETFTQPMYVRVKFKGEEKPSFFKTGGKELLDPEAFLKEYELTANDPSLQEQQKIIKSFSDTSKQTPVAKAFNKCYPTIDDAIPEFLADIYKWHSANQYTYLQGNNEGGLYIFSDSDRQFAYSHHTSDPVSKYGGATPYWLVYIHKGKEKGMNISEFDSWLLNTYPNIRARFDQKEKQQQDDRIQQFIKDGYPVKKREGLSWVNKFEIDSKSGKRLKNYANTLLIFRNDNRVKGKFYYNSFTDRIETVKPKSWKKEEDLKSTRAIEKGDKIQARTLCGNKPYRYTPSSMTMVNDCFQESIIENEIHPVREYLETFRSDEWKNRTIEDILKLVKLREDSKIKTYLSSLKSLEEFCPSKLFRIIFPINEIEGRYFDIHFIGAVKRIFEPGCKHDTALCLIGGQGTGKSTLCEYFAIKTEWFTDTVNTIDDQKACESLTGKTVGEISERGDLQDDNKGKAFLSSAKFSLRKVYRENGDDYKKQCMIIITTNDENILRDITGSRRFQAAYIGNKKVKQNLELCEVFNNPILSDMCFAYGVNQYDKGAINYLTEEESIQQEENNQRFYIREIDLGIMEAGLNKVRPEDSSWKKASIEERQAYYGHNFGIEYCQPKNNLLLPKKMCVAEVAHEIFGYKLNIRKNHGKRNSGYDPKDFTNNFRKLGWQREMEGNKPKLTNIKYYGPQQMWVRPQEENCLDE